MKQSRQDCNVNNLTTAGVTLIEVMVSMIILSIGVMLLATLLPISILRTAQASQLTNAVLLKNNVQAFLESNYSAQVSQILGSANIPFAGGAQEGAVIGAVVDPLGLLPYGNIPALPVTFGSTALFSGTPTAPSATITRYNCGLTTYPSAEMLALLPDSWSTVYEGPVTASLAAATPYVTWAGTGTSATINTVSPRNGSNFNTVNPVNSAPYIPYRMSMTSSATGQSAVVPLYVVNASQQLYWWNVNGAGTPVTQGYLPPFTPDRVRIDAMQRRFTALLTVRKEFTPAGPGDQSWAADVEVAIFFNRSFYTTDENPFLLVIPAAGSNYGFDGAPGVAGVDDDGNGITDWTNSPTNTTPDPGEVGWSGSDDNRTVTVTWTPGVTGTPYLKKGGFMLEPAQLKWYRIINLLPFTAASTNTQVLLDQDLRQPTTVSQGIFMRGVVDVYPLPTINGKQ